MKTTTFTLMKLCNNCGQYNKPETKSCNYCKLLFTTQEQRTHDTTTLRSDEL